MPKYRKRPKIEEIRRFLKTPEDIKNACKSHTIVDRLEYLYARLAEIRKIAKNGKCETCKHWPQGWSGSSPRCRRGVEHGLMPNVFGCCLHEAKDKP